MMTLQDLRAAIATHCVALGQDELEVVELIAARLVMGAATYGALDIGQDRRNWAAEARDEGADLAIYLTIQTLKQARELAVPYQPTEEMDMRLKAALMGAIDA